MGSVDWLLQNHLVMSYSYLSDWKKDNITIMLLVKGKNIDLNKTLSIVFEKNSIQI